MNSGTYMITCNYKEEWRHPCEKCFQDHYDKIVCYCMCHWKGEKQ